MTEQQVRIFTSTDGQAQLEVALEQETVWLSQVQMAELFGKDVRTVNEHVSNVLKDHLVQGYTLNQRRLAERGIEFEQAVSLLSRTLTNQGLVSNEGEAVARVISDYARSWSLLQGYDEQQLAEVGIKLFWSSRSGHFY